MEEIGVIVGRFQTPEMNDEIQNLIRHYKNIHASLAILLGEAPIRGSVVNPLPVAARKTLFNEYFPDVDLLSLKDHPSDVEWSKSFDKLLAQQFDGRTIVVYGRKSSFIDRYHGKFKTAEIISVRDKSKKSISMIAESGEFRKGMVYAFQQLYPKVYPTVDIAVFRDDKSEILMGVKSIDRKWRLMGGFADPEDENFEDAAKRELKEECGPIETGEFVIEGSFKIDDWRYRNEKDKIITTLFSTEFVNGEPHGSDDIAEVKWVPLDQLGEMVSRGETAAEHKPLLTHLMGKYLKQ